MYAASTTETMTEQIKPQHFTYKNNLNFKNTVPGIYLFYFLYITNDHLFENIWMKKS